MSNKKKTEQLGINFSTAQNQLKKQILFKYVKLAGDNICYQCKKEIENEIDLSIEHINPWLDNSNAKELFWNLENIKFSHLSCNIKAAKRKIGINHPSQESYKRGCRCEECKNIQKLRLRKYRKNKSREVQVDPGFH